MGSSSSTLVPPDLVSSFQRLVRAGHEPSTAIAILRTQKASPLSSWIASSAHGPAKARLLLVTLNVPLFEMVIAATKFTDVQTVVVTDTSSASTVIAKVMQATGPLQFCSIGIMDHPHPDGRVDGGSMNLGALDDPGSETCKVLRYLASEKLCSGGKMRVDFIAGCVGTVSTLSEFSGMTIQAGARIGGGEHWTLVTGLATKCIEESREMHVTDVYFEDGKLEAWRSCLFFRYVDKKLASVANKSMQERAAKAVPAETVLGEGEQFVEREKARAQDEPRPVNCAEDAVVREGAPAADEPTTVAKAAPAAVDSETEVAATAEEAAAEAEEPAAAAETRAADEAAPEVAATAEEAAPAAKELEAVAGAPAAEDAAREGAPAAGVVAPDKAASAGPAVPAETAVVSDAVAGVSEKANEIRDRSDRFAKFTGAETAFEISLLRQIS